MVILDRVLNALPRYLCSAVPPRIGGYVTGLKRIMIKLFLPCTCPQKKKNLRYFRIVKSKHLESAFFTEDVHVFHFFVALI